MLSTARNGRSHPWCIAVVGERRDAKVDGAIRRRIGIPSLHQALDHPDLMRNVRRGLWFHMRRQQVQRGAVRVELLRPVLREVRERLAGLDGVADRLVIHVRDVPHMQSRRAAQFHDAAENILRNEGAEIADVRGAIHRGAAAVETQRLAIGGRHRQGLSGQGVVEAQRGLVGHGKGGNE